MGEKGLGISSAENKQANVPNGGTRNADYSIDVNYFSESGTLIQNI